MEQQINIKEKVEELGVVFENFGKTPMTSRVFAYLLLAEPPQQSFDEIREFLDASKSAISNSLNTLQLEKSVRYVTFSGDRKRYFLVDGKSWLNQIMNSAKNLSALNSLVADVLETRKDSDYKNFNKELEEMLEFQIYLTENIEKIIADWKTK